MENTQNQSNTNDDLVVEDFNQNDQHSDNNNNNPGQKFSSPEASALRLSKLPLNVLSVMRMSNEEIIFDAFISELKFRCNDHKNRLDKYALERMWTQMVFSICMNFRHEHFHGKSHSLENISPDFLQFMRNSNIIDLLQVLVDVAQQSGFQAKDILMTFENNKDSGITQKDYNEAKNRWNSLQQHYHDYVDLFRRCTGTWRPSKNQKSFANSGTNQNQFIKSTPIQCVNPSSNTNASQRNYPNQNSNNHRYSNNQYPNNRHSNNQNSNNQNSNDQRQFNQNDQRQNNQYYQNNRYNQNNQNSNNQNSNNQNSNNQNSNNQSSNNQNSNRNSNNLGRNPTSRTFDNSGNNLGRNPVSTSNNTNNTNNNGNSERKQYVPGSYQTTGGNFRSNTRTNYTKNSNQ